MGVLAKIRQSGFTVSVSDDKLIISPSSRLTNEQRNFIKQHKDELISELKAANDGALRLEDKTAILRWLTWINENNQEIIDDVLEHCRTDPEGLAYYLKRAEEVPNDGDQSSSKLVSCGAFAHFDSNHPHGGGSGICKADVMPIGACHWSDTLRHCKDFKNGQ